MMTAAIALLTRIPVRTDGTSTGAAAFGLVGALLGVAAAAPVLVLGPLSPPLVGAVLAIAVLAVASGALHLDGLADTADALAAPNGEAAERARQDPRVGAAGVVAIVLVLALDVTALAGLSGWSMWVAAAALVAAVAASRAAATVAPFVAGEARPGFGRWFAERTTRTAAAVALLTAVAAAVALSVVVDSLAPLYAGLGTVVAGTVAALVIGRMRGGLDGDACGAVIELSLAAGLVTSVSLEAAAALAASWN
jgi:adenosylcobinamide-GDP ribazoletransferase